MTNIEQKAMELVNEVLAERRLPLYDEEDVAANLYTIDAICRAIEQHEAFRQEVSEAVEETANVVYSDSSLIVRSQMKRFIITKPDPLVEAMVECGFGDSSNAADDIRAALAKRGLEIREKE